MKLGDSDREHESGNKECPECWGDDFPMTCKCGGLVHSVFGDEDYEGYWLYYKCDKCGSEDNPRD